MMHCSRPASTVRSHSICLVKTSRFHVRFLILKPLYLIGCRISEPPRGISRQSTPIKVPSVANATTTLPINGEVRDPCVVRCNRKRPWGFFTCGCSFLLRTFLISCVFFGHEILPLCGLTFTFPCIMGNEFPSTPLASLKQPH
jgi:hypothetical protein